MEALYEQVLNRTLKLESPRGTNYVYKTVNNTPLPLILKMYSAIDLSPVMEGHYIPPKLSFMQQHLFVGDCQIFSCAATGGFVCAKMVVDSTTDAKYKTYPEHKELWGQVPVGATVQTVLSSADPGLIEPNDVGGCPVPNKTTLIPHDSGKFVVGAGPFTLPPDKGNKQVLLIHEQYWKRSPASFSLGPNSTKTVALVVTTGRTETTSSETQIKATLGIEVSGGWGPISASMSASLEYGSSFTRTVSVSETSQSTVEEHYENKLLDKQKLFIFWNLVDSYTFVDFDAKSSTKPPFTVLAVIESVQTPSLLRVYEFPLS